MASFNFQNNSNAAFGSSNSQTNSNNMVNQFSGNNQSNFNNQANFYQTMNNQTFGQPTGAAGMSANNNQGNNGYGSNTFQSNPHVVKAYSPMPPILKKGIIEFKPVRSRNPKLD